jgi:ABC-type multidrug transport system fused ATPase/permease subunit
MDAGRDLRRMESNSRSPIFASFGETLEGIVTVRAFSAERRFLNTLHARVDETTKFWYGHAFNLITYLTTFATGTPSGCSTGGFC